MLLSHIITKLLLNVGNFSRTVRIFLGSWENFKDRENSTYLDSIDERHPDSALLQLVDPADG